MTSSTSRPLKVKHKKFKGDYRRVTLLGDNFRITFSQDGPLRLRFRDHVKGAHWQAEKGETGASSGGYYLLPFTKENALTLLKFGIENDFRFSHEMLHKTNQLVRGEAQPNETPVPRN